MNFSESLNRTKNYKHREQKQRHLEQKKNVVNIKWEKASNVSGYEIQISNDKKFKKNVSIYTEKVSKSSKKIKVSRSGKNC